VKAAARVVPLEAASSGRPGDVRSVGFNDSRAAAHDRAARAHDKAAVQRGDKVWQHQAAAEWHRARRDAGLTRGLPLARQGSGEPVWAKGKCYGETLAVYFEGYQVVVGSFSARWFNSKPLRKILDELGGDVVQLDV
jgi:hypothetical protein